MVHGSDLSSCVLGCGGGEYKISLAALRGMHCAPFSGELAEHYKATTRLPT